LIVKTQNKTQFRRAEDGNFDRANVWLVWIWCWNFLLHNRKKITDPLSNYQLLINTLHHGVSYGPMEVQDRLRSE